jgi:hypothetical protein
VNELNYHCIPTFNNIITLLFSKAVNIPVTTGKTNRNLLIQQQQKLMGKMNPPAKLPGASKAPINITSMTSLENSPHSLTFLGALINNSNLHGGQRNRSTKKCYRGRIAITPFAITHPAQKPSD